MKGYIIGISMALGCALSLQANTVLFEENFNTKGKVWMENFPTLIDADHKAQPSNVWPYFHDSETGKAQPWWPLMDSGSSENRYLTSHSIYTEVGKSSDWVSSRAITIPGEGYRLEFDAQSLAFRAGDPPRISDLWVFVTETPVVENALPTKEFAHVEQVPFGKSITEMDGEFTHYIYSLDDYIGKTIYISFANLNDDKDMVAIDNVLVQRLDRANLYVEADEMVVNGTYNVKATVEAATHDVGSYTVTINGADGYTYSVNGSNLAVGQKREVELPLPVAPDKTFKYNVTLKFDKENDIVVEREMTGLTFRPFRKVLVEESTSYGCVNCPIGLYNMDQLSENEETREYAIPVSIHISGLGEDYLVVTDYAGLFQLTYAPAFRVNRDLNVGMFSTNVDTSFDPYKEGSFGNLVRQRHEKITTLDMDLDAEYVYTDGDATAVKCNVTVKPALSMNAENMGIGIIMKENNVRGEGDNHLLMQENNYAGHRDQFGAMGGWTGMPNLVMDMVSHDVARGVWGFRGIENSLPKQIEADKEYNFEYTVIIPDTYFELNGMVGSPAIKPENVIMVAYVYDKDKFEVLNANDCPMSETANIRDNEFLKASVEEVGADVDVNAPVEFFDLQGRRVVNPESGIYIRKQGSRTTKVIVK